MTRDPYDERPYTEHAYAEAHPARVAAVARLAGWRPPAVGGARVLELGCGRGGNLLPMAAGLPGAALVGVDASARQIDEARRIAREAGLANVTLARARFEEAALTDEAFDYVIVHGVLSWIPPAARPVLLERAARALAPGGIAYVSFNVLPGWYDRLAARDWLRFDAAALGGAADGAAGSLAWLGAQVSPEEAGARRRLDAVARRLREAGPAYAAHEYLAPEHHPLLVGDFLREAAAAGLRYLGDALPATTALDLLPAAARERARSLDPDAAQQLVDFVRWTAFRRALLVRAADARAAAWAPPTGLDPAALIDLHVASRLRPGREDAVATLEPFADGDAVVQVSDPAARRALHELAREAPRSLPFVDLARRCLPADASEAAPRALAAELLDLGLATGALDLYGHELAVVARPGDRPVACPVARWHARHGGVVTSRLHHEVLVPDDVVRWVLARLDGTRAIADLAAEARALDARGATTDAERERLVAASVERLAACGVIVGG